MKIQVTAEDIANGERKDEESCPIALATRRQLERDVYVYEESIDVGLPQNLDLPIEAKAFIASFDKDGPTGVAPFEFELPVPTLAVLPGTIDSLEIDVEVSL